MRWRRAAKWERSGVVAELFYLGSSQPKPLARRRKLLTSASREIALLHEDFLAIRRKSQRLNSAVRTRAQLDFFLLEILLLRRHSTVSESQRRVVPDWLDAACLGIKKTEHLPQVLESFYRLAGRSPDHVARACRTHLGISPTDIVNAARLSGTDETILDIADDCGLPTWLTSTNSLPPVLEPRHADTACRPSSLPAGIHQRKRAARQRALKAIQLNLHCDASIHWDCIPSLAGTGG
jgi:AraC-like DNA-binding protein